MAMPVANKTTPSKYEATGAQTPCRVPTTTQLISEKAYRRARLLVYATHFRAQ